MWQGQEKALIKQGRPLFLLVAIATPNRPEWARSVPGIRPNVCSGYVDGFVPMRVEDSISAVSVVSSRRGDKRSELHIKSVRNSETEGRAAEGTA